MSFLFLSPSGHFQSKHEAVHHYKTENTHVIHDTILPPPDILLYTSPHFCFDVTPGCGYVMLALLSNGVRVILCTCFLQHPRYKNTQLIEYA